MLQQNAKQNTLKTGNAVTRTITALLLSMSMSIAHAAEPDTCHVVFAALNNNQPLLAQSATTIRNAEKIVFDSKNHSFTTTLPCGQTYVVTVTSGITTRTSEFRALPYNNIRVEMGDTK